MKRRDFLKSTAAVTGAGLLSGFDIGAAPHDQPVPGPTPNILFILVDELRFPTAFPQGIDTPEDFLKNYMPNVYNLWKSGVKFANYHTAANACTPSRGCIITGLYSQQHWLITTILSTPPDPSIQPPPPPPNQPVLNPAFPTYGRLLRRAGYVTPYVGKWHVTVPGPSPDALEEYGFDFMTYYDPTGSNLQGTYGNESQGFHNDAYSGSQAVSWLKNNRPTDTPWCLTVSFVNPHDREFFPQGTEFQTVNNLFTDPLVNPLGFQSMATYPGTKNPDVDWDTNALKSPPFYNNPTLPPNWQSASDIAAKNLPTQTLIREFQQGVWGGVTDDSSKDKPEVVHYQDPIPSHPHNLGVMKMPFSYWQRGMDSYIQIMGIVDAQIGCLLKEVECLPPDVRENTVIVFAADHGEYNGAHGFVQGKMGTVYEEAWHVPLIVVDPSGRFTDDIDEPRMGLASSVDLMPMLVSIGYRGTRAWMTPPLKQIYSQRLDMIAMLKSSSAQGRPYVLYEFDEIIPDFYNFNGAPLHVLGVRTPDAKLGAYMRWRPLTADIIPGSESLEFYDLTTPDGRLEMVNTASSDPRARLGYKLLVNHIIPKELQEPLPPPFRIPQAASKLAHLLFREAVAQQPESFWLNGGLTNLLGYGSDF